MGNNDIKAWRVSCKSICNEPWHWDNIIVYAETRNKAKSKATKDNHFDGAEILVAYFGELSRPRRREVEYKDLVAHRVKSLDKVLYNGEVMTITQRDEKFWEESRDLKAKELAENFPNETVVIYCGQYGKYWGPNRSGYTSDVKLAGLYSTAEAYDIISGNSYHKQETVVLMSYKEIDHEIDKEINILKEKIQGLEKLRRK